MNAELNELPAVSDGASKHEALIDMNLGGLKIRSRLTIGTDGLLAISALVGVILAGTACIVWIATASERLRTTNK